MKFPLVTLLITVVCLFPPSNLQALESGKAGAGVDLKEDQPLFPMIRANTLFNISKSQRAWAKAYERATSSFADLGVQPQRFAQMMPSGFRRIKNFRAEVYGRDPEKEHCELTILVSAEEAWPEKDKPQEIQLRNLRLVFFVSPRVMKVVGDQTGNQTGKQADVQPAATPFLPAHFGKSRIVVKAQRGTVDVSTGEGHAFQNTIEKKAGVHITVFSTPKDDAPTTKMAQVAKMSCPGLHWRAWIDPRSGISEVTLLATSPDVKTEPVVRGEFTNHDPETKQESKMKIVAQGMVLLTSILDHMQPVRDEAGAVLGLTNVVQRRVLFHRKINVLMEGSASAPIVPFQQAPTPGTAKETKKEKKPSEPPQRTVVKCAGPAILDLAVPPRTLPPGPEDRLVPMAMRFTFLNGVRMDKYPLNQPAKGQPASTETTLHCRHLCFQFPPGATATLPEYADAMGGVVMKGTRPVTETGAPTPFRVDCHRVYFDSATDSTVLQGVKGGSRLEIVDELGELYTQSCYISRKTQTLTMPREGPKRAVVRGTRKAVPVEKTATDSAIDFGAGDLVAEWHGTFGRQVVTTLGPGNVETLKEILLLNKRVTIQQAQKGLYIEGEKIRIVRDANSGQVERLEGHGDVLVRSSGMQVKGERVTVNLRYNEKAEIVQNTVIVWSPPESGRYAVLWQGQSAARGQRFVIDALNNNFQAYGGVVGRFILPKASEKTGAEAAGGTALMPGFSAGGNEKAGGNRIALQCDGDFEFNGTTGQLRVTRNVLMRQGTLSIVADGMLLTLAPPAKDAKAVGKNKEPKAETGPFSSSVESIECRGGVEITTPTQVVHSDRLFYNMASEKIALEMDHPQHKVRVYLLDSSGGTKLLEVTRRLDYDATKGIFSPAERMYLKPYKETKPLPRQKTTSTSGGQQP